MSITKLYEELTDKTVDKLVICQRYKLCGLECDDYDIDDIYQDFVEDKRDINLSEFLDRDPRTIAFCNGISLDDIETLLSTGFAAAGAFDKVDYDVAEYTKARLILTDTKGLDSDRLTLELVQTEMLYMGYSLRLHEIESTNWHELDKNKLLKGLNMARKEKSAHTYIEEGDFYECEAVFQYAIFGEVIV